MITRGGSPEKKQKRVEEPEDGEEGCEMLPSGHDIVTRPWTLSSYGYTKPLGGQAGQNSRMGMRSKYLA